MIRYETVASQIVRGSYTLTSGEALSVAQLLEAHGLPEDIDHVLGGEDDAKIAARLESLTRALRTELLRHETRLMICPLVESTIAPGSFLSTLVVNSSEPQPVHDRYARLRETPRLAEILYQLTPVEFEKLCGLVLEVIGCSAVTVTQSSKDDGVDVIAELPMKVVRGPTAGTAPIFYRVIGGLSFLVFGQAKRYAADNPVGKEAVSELQGSWTATRNQYADGTLAKERREALVRADFRAADPVLLLMMTSSRLTSGAAAKAEALGMVALEGQQLAQLLLEAEVGFERAGGACLASVDVLRAQLA